MLPAIRTLPVPALSKVPAFRFNVLETTKAPALVLVNDVPEIP